MVFDAHNLVVPDIHLSLAVVSAHNYLDSAYVAHVEVGIVDIGQLDHVYTVLQVAESDSPKREAAVRCIVADTDAVQTTVAVAASLF